MPPATPPSENFGKNGKFRIIINIIIILKNGCAGARGILCTSASSFLLTTVNYIWDEVNYNFLVKKVNTCRII